MYKYMVRYSSKPNRGEIPFQNTVYGRIKRFSWFSHFRRAAAVKCLLDFFQYLSCYLLANQIQNSVHDSHFSDSFKNISQSVLFLQKNCIGCWTSVVKHLDNFLGRLSSAQWIFPFAGFVSRKVRRESFQPVLDPSARCPSTTSSYPVFEFFARHSFVFCSRSKVAHGNIVGIW